jgi:ABC-type Co2+ transport system permease subunit
LLERTVNLKIEEVYSKLKAVLVEKGCKVISEEPPSQISFKQGSLWGIAPQTAKKNITVNLEPVDGGTRVKFSSKLASDWKNVTLIGCAFALVLAGICVWMATDLTTAISTHQNTYWSWLVSAGGNVDSAAAQSFVNLTWGLAAFLSVIILLEGAIVVYVHSRIDAFSKDILNQLS